MKPYNNKQKRVLVMGINFSPELTGIGKYTGEMADWLADSGYTCTVLTSFPYYPNWKILEPYSGRFYTKEAQRAGQLSIYRCPLYVPEEPTGIRRICHEASFLLSAFFMTIYLLFKPAHQHIFCIAPPFHLGFLALLYRFFKGGKIIYHIQDLQIEAARDLRVLKTGSVFRPLFAMERFIISHANYISTISPGMLQKVRQKAQREVILFPNWVDTQFFYPLLNNRGDIKKSWGFDPTDKIVLYSGSIGEKQGLESLLSIARMMADRQFIKFVICGNGPYKEKLLQLAAEYQLNNFHFIPTQPLNTFNALLNMTDVHLVLQKRNACDLMMPSKLTAIWSAGGLALVTAEPGSTLHTVIKAHNMGVVIDCEDEKLLMDTIIDCCLSDYSPANLNARRYAEKFLNKNNILQDLMDRVDEPAFLSAGIFNS